MAIPLQLRRGTKAQNDVFTGALGEVTVDTENKNLRLHDGSTAGGVEFPNSTNVLTGFKNHIINGGMDIWQRGISFTPNNAYTADRWKANVGSNADVLKTRETIGSRGKTNVLTINTNTMAVSDVSLIQEIEDVVTLNGDKCTISFKFKASELISGKYVVLTQVFGTGGSADIPTLLSFASQITTVDTWTDVELTFNLPSIDGKTRNDVDSSLRVTLQIGDGANPVQDNSSYSFAQVQLEEGSVATPFEQRPIGLELDLCRRYYRTITTSGLDFRLRNTNNQGVVTIMHTDGMRVFPATTFTPQTNVISVQRTNFLLLVYTLPIGATQVTYTGTATADAEIY